MLRNALPSRYHIPATFDNGAPFSIARTASRNVSVAFSAHDHIHTDPGCDPRLRRQARIVAADDDAHRGLQAS